MQGISRARGFLAITDPYGTVTTETYTCNHCNRTGEVKDRKQTELLAVTCHSCFSYVCPNCAGVGKCEPFEKRLEAYERRHRLLAQACA